MKNILLAVCGLSPQVITETLFALFQQGRKVDEIHIVTTRAGKEAINANLLNPCDGKYYKLLNDYAIDFHNIAFGHGYIHTITDKNGVELDDITDEEDNELLLKKCLELAFQHTADPETAVFFSIAGGRKTMSACLTLAAQFYGRRQDRLFHVLVSPEFESNRDFYYPPPESLAIELRDKEGHPYFKETKYAKVTLAPMPFVSVRSQLTDDMLKTTKDPATLLLSLIREERPQLVIDIPQRKVVYRGREVDMTPSRLALYAFFAMQKKDCSRENTDCRRCTDCYLDMESILAHQEKIADIYRRMVPNRDFAAMSDTGIMGLTKENFNSYKSKIADILKQGFGLGALPEIAIDTVGVRPDTCYGIKMDRDRIRVIF